MCPGPAGPTLAEASLGARSEFVVSIADDGVPGGTAGLGAASGSRRNRQDQLQLITNPLQSSPQ